MYSVNAVALRAGKFLCIIRIVSKLSSHVLESQENAMFVVCLH